MSYIKNNVVMI